MATSDIYKIKVQKNQKKISENLFMDIVQHSLELRKEVNPQARISGDRRQTEEKGEFQTSLVFVNFEFHVCRGVYLYKLGNFP